MKKNFVLLLISFLFLCCSFVKIHAEGDTYTVTVIGGDYGTVNGKASDSKTYTADPAQMCDINSFNVVTTNSKYDFVGFHISGHPEVNVGNFSVEEDTVLVASYAVKGSSIEYTVFYEDADGNPMSAYTDAYDQPVPVSVTLRGPANQDIIVPAIYINGFWPEGYNYRLTVSNPVKEVHIVYHPDSELVGPTTTETIYDDTVVYEEGGPAGTGGGGGGTAPVTPVTPVGPQEEIVIPEPEVPQTEPENNVPGDNTPEEIIEPEPVPTAGFWETIFNNPWLLGGTIGGVSLLVLFLLLLFRKKRENAE